MRTLVWGKFIFKERGMLCIESKLNLVPVCFDPNNMFTIKRHQITLINIKNID